MQVAPNETEMKKGEFRNRLNICCRDAFFDKAMLVVEEMTAAGFPLNMEQYTQLIHLCASAPPDQWKYTQLIHLCASAPPDQWKEGEMLLAGVVALKLTEPLEGEKLLAGVVDMKLTERLASGIIKLQCCLGNVDEALKLTEPLASGIIKLQCCLGNVDEALKCFDEMAAADLCFDEMAAADMVRKRRTYAPLLAALGEASPSRIEDAIQDAFRVFADSQKHEVRPAA
ncbi:hypothetical protein T484DRAFT_1810986 [Baffinella frigidus]|nr:hypothetical protein T484DRAFT_1810986 [Cryptophyta sp. CCMP2293]